MDGELAIYKTEWGAGWNRITFVSDQAVVRVRDADDSGSIVELIHFEGTKWNFQVVRRRKECQTVLAVGSTAQHLVTISELEKEVYINTFKISEKNLIPVDSVPIPPPEETEDRWSIFDLTQPGKALLYEPGTGQCTFINFEICAEKGLSILSSESILIQPGMTAVLVRPRNKVLCLDSGTGVVGIYSISSSKYTTTGDESSCQKRVGNVLITTMPFSDAIVFYNPNAPASPCDSSYSKVVFPKRLVSKNIWSVIIMLPNAFHFCYSTATGSVLLFQSIQETDGKGRKKILASGLSEDDIPILTDLDTTKVVVDSQSRRQSRRNTSLGSLPLPPGPKAISGTTKAATYQDQVMEILRELKTTLRDPTQAYADKALESLQQRENALVDNAVKLPKPKPSWVHVVRMSPRIATPPVNCKAGKIERIIRDKQRLLDNRTPLKAAELEGCLERLNSPSAHGTREEYSARWYKQEELDRARTTVRLTKKTQEQFCRKLYSIPMKRAQETARRVANKYAEPHPPVVPIRQGALIRRLYVDGVEKRERVRREAEDQFLVKTHNRKNTPSEQVASITRMYNLQMKKSAEARAKLLNKYL
eukprot:TRINITY_DN475_c1_g1_i13.p1 TRINITY_DN475_c1_g1~~TRINITY_DN475_c1_g1_i13.p1  ORF type:complete len:591 (+),score=64.78 TRINITY_DN475_c1_g1_i13:35-1807(+)